MNNFQRVVLLEFLILCVNSFTLRLSGEITLPDSKFALVK